jgi:hypothetical protein
VGLECPSSLVVQTEALAITRAQLPLIIDTTGERLMANVTLPPGLRRTRVPLLIVGALVGMAIGFWVHVYKVENKVYKEDLPLAAHYELWTEHTIVGMAIGLAIGLGIDVLVDVLRGDFRFGLLNLFMFVTMSAAVSAALAPRPRILLLGLEMLIVMAIAFGRVLLDLRRKNREAR